MGKEKVPPRLEFAFEIQAQVGRVQQIGAKGAVTRCTVAILGGRVRGPGLSGAVRPGGADWQFVHANGLTEVDAQYLLETEDGALIEVRNQGIRFGAPEVLARLAAGETVVPSEYYFRSTPRFFVADGPYAWLKESVFIADGERYADRVVIHVWRVK